MDLSTLAGAFSFANFLCEVVVYVKLSPKQQRFADEYLIDLNATQAAIRAGYSPKSAEQQGSRLLRNAKVRAYIDERMAEHSRNEQASTKNVSSANWLALPSWTQRS